MLFHTERTEHPGGYLKPEWQWKAYVTNAVVLDLTSSSSTARSGSRARSRILVLLAVVETAAAPATAIAPFEIPANFIVATTPSTTSIISAWSGSSFVYFDPSVHEIMIVQLFNGLLRISFLFVSDKSEPP